MEARERRELIRKRLEEAGKPITGTALAKETGVSRQVIVGDIAILRAAGCNIYATPEGYILPHKQAAKMEVAVLACRHGRAELARELEIIIDNGGKVLDVVVEHPVYGEIKGNLMLESRYQLAEFLRRLSGSGAEPLSIITGGVHLHRVAAPSQEVLARIKSELKDIGILMNE
ncbi:MAG: transcription repressor NadR [Negativicutes bacterium]|nr:transcription repressor NadR [Negativicutes bacterium]